MRLADTLRIMTSAQQGQLRIITKYHWLTLPFALFKPIATINGRRVRLNWGENLIPALAGTHQIGVHIPYLWKFGKADIVADNSTGAPTIHYAAPMWNCNTGAIGHEPQDHPGRVGAVAVYAMLALLIVGGVVNSVVQGL